MAPCSLMEAQCPPTAAAALQAAQVGGGRRRKRLQHLLRRAKRIVAARQQRQGATMGSSLDALEQALHMLQSPTEHPTSGASSSACSSSAASSPASVPAQVPSVSPPVEMSGGSGTILVGRRLLGQLFVSLPDGTVLESRDACTPLRADEAPLSVTIRAGDSLLSALHGKGAQTLLLNAFCGHSRRRMYARLKWGDSVVRACELLCEFSKDAHSVSRRVASIQLFCVQSAQLRQDHHHQHLQQHQQQQQQQLTFTTRHNASGALIYLDAASIPLLGHFPSEITGKSLFTIVHPEDAPRVRDAHQQLHSSAGQHIVRTPGLRLAAFAGHSVPVHSEWAAFVNPWTRHIEMVVGRHAFVGLGERCPNGLRALNAPETEANDAFVQALFTKPVGPCAPLDVPEQQHQQDLVMEALQPTAVKEEVLPPEAEQPELPHQQHQQVYLSYNQINCLENVHRLLKSQSGQNSQSGGGGDEKMEPQHEHLQQQQHSSSLTRELLQQHDQRWQQECRAHWRRRLSATGQQKRPHSHEQQHCETPPPSKLARCSSEGANNANEQHRHLGPPSADVGASPLGGAELALVLGVLQQQANKFPDGDGGGTSLLSALPQQPHLVEQLLHAAQTARQTLISRLIGR